MTTKISIGARVTLAEEPEGPLRRFLDMTGIVTSIVGNMARVSFSRGQDHHGKVAQIPVAMLKPVSFQVGDLVVCILPPAMREALSRQMLHHIRDGDTGQVESIHAGERARVRYPCGADVIWPLMLLKKKILH